MCQVSAHPVAGYTSGYTGDYAEAPATDSPVLAQMESVVREQHRTYDLLENLNNRLNAVLDFNGVAKSADGPRPVAGGASPLHGVLIEATERQAGINARIAELLNRITL